MLVPLEKPTREIKFADDKIDIRSIVLKIGQTLDYAYALEHNAGILKRDKDNNQRVRILLQDLDGDLDAVIDMAKKAKAEIKKVR